MEKFKDFWRQYRTPALIGGGILLFLLCAVTGAALWLTRGFWMDAQETAIHATEPVTEAETIAVITEPPTTMPPTTEPPTTQPPTTEPPTTEPPPASAMIENVPYYSQHGLLPTGCELVSAKMLLEYYTGREVDMQDIIDRVDCQYPQDVDGIPCAPHPSEAFIGSPWDETSFGCFSPIICDMMNNLLPRGYVAVDTTGTELSELAETYIPQGRPVLVWATIAMLQSFPHMGWYLMDEHGKPTDEWYDWLANEHCLVLIGYDEDYYYFNDPYAWRTGTRYGREIVEKRYAEMDQYSAVVLPVPENSTEPATYVPVRETEPTEPETTDITNPPMP